MDRKELQALLDEHFETPLEGERLEMLDRALTQDPELRREFEAHRQILETLRTLAPPSAPASLRGRILAQARAEIEEKVSVPTDASSPRRKATVFSLVRTVCTRWQVQTLAAACLAVVLFYQVLPHLNTSLRQRDLFEKIAQSPSDSQEESKAATIATDLERHNRDEKSGSEVLNPESSPANQPTRSAGDLHYFYNSKPSDASPEIAPPIPFLTGDVPPAPGSKHDAVVADSPARGSGEKERESPDTVSAPEAKTRSSGEKKNEQAQEALLASPVEALEMFSEAEGTLVKTASRQTKTIVSNAEQEAASRGRTVAQPAADPVEQVFRASGRDTREEFSRLGADKDQTVGGAGGRAGEKQSPTPTAQPARKGTEKPTQDAVELFSRREERKNADETRRSASVSGAAGGAEPSVAHPAQPRVRPTVEEKGSVFQSGDVGEPAKERMREADADPAVSPKSVEVKQKTPAPQKVATPQLARQMVEPRPDRLAPGGPAAAVEKPAAQEKEKTRIEDRGVTPSPERTVKPAPDKETGGVGAFVKRVVGRDEKAAGKTNRAEKKEPKVGSAFGRMADAEVEKPAKTPAPSRPKQTRSASVSLVVSVQVNSDVSLEDVARLFRGGATVTQSAGSGKTLGTLTCTAPGKNQQWVLEQLRGAGIQAQAASGAKGTYRVSQSNAPRSGEAEFVFRITVTRR